VVDNVCNHVCLHPSNDSSVRLEKSVECSFTVLQYVGNLCKGLPEPKGLEVNITGYSLLRSQCG
jgi:hypothetical protein